MAMTKTAVDKNYCFIFLQNYIGGAGQFPIVDSEPQTAGKQIFAHNQLGTSVFALYRSHASATLSGCHHVSHAKFFRANLNDWEGLRYKEIRNAKQ